MKRQTACYFLTTPIQSYGLVLHTVFDHSPPGVNSSQWWLYFLQTDGDISLTTSMILILVLISIILHISIYFVPSTLLHSYSFHYLFHIPLPWVLLSFWDTIVPFNMIHVCIHIHSNQPHIQRDKISPMFFSPFPVMTTQTTEKQDGLRALESAITKVTSKITSYGGTLSVKMAPKVRFPKN